MKKIAKVFAVAITSALIAGFSVEVIIRTFDLFAADRSVFGEHQISSADSEDNLEAGKPVAADQLSRTLIHPYLGWSIRPSVGNPGFFKARNFFPNGVPTEWAMANLDLNAFGYRSAIHDYREIGSDDFVVGLIGGSVAAQIALFAGDHIASAMAAGLGVDHDSIAILNLGGGGYKQPQQVITFIEMIMLGVDFDYVINIDGVNEVVFGAQDARKNYHPFFPSSGHLRSSIGLTTGMPTDDQTLCVAGIISERRSADRLVGTVNQHWLLSRSELAKAFIGTRVQKHRVQSVIFEEELQTLASLETGGIPMVSLSDPCLGKTGDCWDLIGGLWRDGSLLMKTICDDIGAQYVHVLQPNQYVRGSKPLTQEELDAAYSPGGPFDRFVSQGYPVLHRYSADLVDSGIRFLDLTSVFENEPRTLYVDDCCHLNHTGYSMLAHEIARFVVASDDRAQVEIVEE